MKKIVLIVLDGYGIAPNSNTNPISLANPKFLNQLINEYPNTKLNASGEAVGLPKGEVGNSEVGHINLGAGRIVPQDLLRINASIENKTFFQNPAFLNAVSHIKKTNSKIHLLGLVSSGVVHSCLNHLFALLDFLKNQHVNNVFLHLITDGRDSSPTSGINIVETIENKLKELQIGKIASVMGRYYAMDRDFKWDRTEKAYLCLTQGSEKIANTASEAIENSYKEDVTDEFVFPVNIKTDSNQIVTIENNDALIFFNYRIDRPRQLTKAFVLDNFENDANKKSSFDSINESAQLRKPFIRNKKINNLFFVTMTEYEKDLSINIAFSPVRLNITLGNILSKYNKKQLRITESEKERFVTFYFNGQNEEPYNNEDRIIIPSPNIETYDLKPEMSAFEITDNLLSKIKENNYDFILVNFANADMVGHTGNISACIKAVQTLNECIKKIADKAIINNYSILITSDHGNIERQKNLETEEVSTEHTANPVPLIIIDKDYKNLKLTLPEGILADIAPTILYLMEIEKPKEMTGENLLKKANLV